MMTLELSILFISYIAAGLTIGLLVFLWALKNGQFKDQERARFLPMENEPEFQPGKLSRLSQYETWILFFLACAGLFTIGATLLFSLML
ncbi:MAG: cbb3-type cytochrome oxidase assembly protein CcoS [Desulfobacterales bacterium]|nr:cbb3-type cytochrome oxidase assembly protein CcoS [Desulfobacterales bacterium]